MPRAWLALQWMRRGAGFGSVVRVVRGLDVLVPVLVDMLQEYVSSLYGG